MDMQLAGEMYNRRWGKKETVLRTREETLGNQKTHSGTLLENLFSSQMTLYHFLASLWVTQKDLCLKPWGTRERQQGQY